MKTARVLFFTAVMAVAVSACSDKKPTNNIIAHKPVKKASSAPVRMQDYERQDNVEWLGKSYKIMVKRRVDTGLPVIVDDAGGRYHDNVIDVTVVRPDGTAFFEKKFSKEDFSSCLSENYMKKSALLGIVFEKAEGDNLRFAASVGAPDVLSDDYVPLILTLSRMGNVGVSKDSRLDSNNNKVQDEEDGV